MKLNLPQHPCTNKCTEFKNEPCNHCLIMANLPELESTKSDFLVGDVVVRIEGNIDQLLTVTTITPHPTNSKMNMIDYEGGRYFGWVREFNLRLATVAELHAKRRLTEAEHALAEVS